MADSITRDDTTNGSVSKTFVLSTTNTLFSNDPHLSGIHLEGSKYGRPFVPVRVTISYGAFTAVRVFTATQSPAGTAGSTFSGSVTYYDPASVVSNTRPYAFQSKTLLPLSAMPSWLSTLVTPYI